MDNLKLGTIVFFSGAVVMILELTGSRVLAPYLGTSIFVWTSLIGIILGSLSLGYYWGGKIADKHPNNRNFSRILFTAALLITLSTLFKEDILSGIEKFIPDLRIGSILATLVLFAPASIILGMVSPYAVKLKIQDLAHSGRTVGNLYAISTVGSIAGTFASGFFLIAIFGNTMLLFMLAVTMAVLSILANHQKPFHQIVTIIAIIAYGALAPQANADVIEIDTQYNHVRIYDDADYYSGKPVKLLKINKNSSSAMYLDSDELVFPYTRFYRLARHFTPEIKNTLMIGGGAYSFPKTFIKELPDAEMDVVEIDPALTELSKKYFKLRDDPRLHIFHEDGRTFLNRSTTQYDVIFGDAYKAYYSIPQQLTTIEAMQKVSQNLSPEGVFIINVISPLNGDFFKAEIATLKAVFPQVYAFPVQFPEDVSLNQNIVIVALKSEQTPTFKSYDPELHSYLKHLWTEEIPADLPVLTDDFAPVDQYIMKLL